MKNSNFEVLLYETANGKIPFIDFMDTLSYEMQAKVHKAISYLWKEGNQIRYPLSRKLLDGVFELRVIERNNISRIFYFFYYDKKIVIMNGYIKKTNKTSSKELDKAILYKKDWLRRHNNEIWWLS